MINLKVLAKTLLSDWGFYYTVTTNLKKVKDSLRSYDALTKSDAKILEGRIDKLLNYLGSQPKSLGWKLRARIGTKKKWYNDVEEWEYFSSEQPSSTS